MVVSFLLVLVVVAAAVLVVAGCPLVGGRPVVVAEWLLAGLRAERAAAAAVAGRPLVAGPRGPLFRGSPQAPAAASGGGGVACAARGAPCACAGLTLGFIARA